MTQEIQQIIHSYHGKLTFDIIEEILQESKRKLDAMHLALIVKKRVYTVLVECLENTYKHNDYTYLNNKQDQVDLMLGMYKDNFVVNISNYVNRENLGELTNKIEKVNSLEINELNKLYRESISKAKISDKGGAGLGIIEIARSSRQKIVCNIIEEKESAIHVSLQIIIANSVKTNC